MTELTLSIIKPDAIAKGHLGRIYTLMLESGLNIVAAKMMHLTEAQAVEFYAIHQERPFFKDLVAFMSSGPIMVQVLEGDNAIARYRDLMGATNPAEAAAHTIRGQFAESIDANAVHGSDAAETAAIEIPFFFKASELVNTTEAATSA